jgi:hypothetical protein
MLPYTTALFLVAAVYTAWTLYSRYSEQKDTAADATETEAAKDRKAVAGYGGDEFKVLNFSADARSIKSGERLGLCYGVSNAIKVKIEPGVEPLKPAVAHCTEAFPKKTTTFTLTAEDKAGHTQTASLTVQVE